MVFCKIRQTAAAAAGNLRQMRLLPTIFDPCLLSGHLSAVRVTNGIIISSKEIPAVLKRIFIIVYVIIKIIGVSKEIIFQGKHIGRRNIFFW